MYRYLFSVICDSKPDVSFEYIARNFSTAYKMLLDDFSDSSFLTFHIDFYRVSKTLVNPVYQCRSLPKGYLRDFSFDSCRSLVYYK